MKRHLLVAAGAVAVTLTGCTATASAPPDACLDALDAAENLLAISSSMAGISADVLAGPVITMVDAAINRDVVGMERATATITDYQAQIEALTAQVQASDYPALADQCRGTRD